MNTCLHLQNGSSALHAAVMGGNIRTVLLLLEANADPTLPNKVRRDVDLRDGQIISAWLNFSLMCVLQYNELPADLTKSERILKILHPKILNGDSWWSPVTLLLPVNTRHKTSTTHTESSLLPPTTICTVLLKSSCHMLNKTGLTLEQHSVQPKKNAFVCHHRLL